MVKKLSKIRTKTNRSLGLESVLVCLVQAVKNKPIKYRNGTGHTRTRHLSLKIDFNSQDFKLKSKKKI